MEETIPVRRTTFSTVALAVVAAFLLRVVPSFENVLTAGGINFQEFDPWFHVRTLQNLLAHFPWRSGFDPYAIYPNGGAIPTGPFWDYLMASITWAVGLGSPSFGTAEHVAVWLPPVLGSLFPLVVFWLSRRLFDNLTALFAAWWIALLPGTLLWMGHLGMADHHVAESLTALLVFGCTCAAVEAASARSARLWTVTAGISLGAFLATRPAGIFVIAILVAASLLQPALARITAVVLAIGALLFIPVSGVLWSRVTWVTLGGGIAVTLASIVLDALWRRNNWRRKTFWLALLGASVLVVAAALLIRPVLFHLLLVQLNRAAGRADSFASVQEAGPLLRAAGSSPWQALFLTLGFSWFLALPALVAVIYTAWRTRRPAMVLFAVWSAVMTIAAFAQFRMTVYFAVNAAILAAVASAWLVRIAGLPKWRKLALALACLLIAANLPIDWLQMRVDISPNLSWRQALNWLRDKTPEPLGDARAWTRYYPASGTPFAYPPSAYSVAVMWYHGYWVEYLARRIPSSNGTGAGGGETANFFAEGDPAAALQGLDAIGSRYVLAEAVGLDMFSGIVDWSGRPAKDYYRTYVLKGQRVAFYMPGYFRSMAVRLGWFGGKAVKTQRVWVIHSIRGRQKRLGMVNLIDMVREFSSEEEARQFLVGETRPEYELGSFDPRLSCVDLEAVSGLRLAFGSDTSSVTGGVKVFERVK